MNAPRIHEARQRPNFNRALVTELYESFASIAVSKGWYDENALNR